MTLFVIESLRVRYGDLEAVRGVSLQLEPERTMGLVGESGSGKTTLALAALGLLPAPGEVSGGHIQFDGEDLLALPPESLRRRRWVDLAYIPQGAMNALDPVRDLLHQFEATWRAHRTGTARQRAEELCLRVGLDPIWLRHFPHEFSGGMRQRAAIAMAMLFAPRVLVADEPTTGLDVIVQRQVLDLLRDSQRERGMAMLFVSHDIAVVAELCDRVAVMYAGEIVELGDVEPVLSRPFHPYTMGLRRAFPDIRAPERRLVTIPGAPPSLAPPPRGCAFAPRCPFALDLCRVTAPLLAALDDGRSVACHRAAEAAALAAIAISPETWRATD
jgi:oligopeptide/dipeptide ABC transporter ATP-binding protein